MRVPATPPDISKFIRGLTQNRRFPEFVAHLKPTDKKNRYLHWDELRFRPAPDGLTHEEWWALMKLSRQSHLNPTPLQAIGGRNFTYFETDQIRRALHTIDSQARGQVRVDKPIATQESADYYVVRSLIEEPYSSSVLEGAATTRKIAEEMIEGNRTPANISEKMVFNNYVAMRTIKSLRDTALTPEIILNVHAELTAGTLESNEHVGQLRKSTDRVVVEDQSTSETLHVPPPASELPGRLQAICDFANRPAESEPFIHPILRASILHFMIGYDHPFVDGNGRTARALFYWSALRSGYWLLEFASISKEIREAPIKYGQAYLLTETDDGDLTYFLGYHIEIVLKAIQSLNTYLERKTTELKAFDALVRPPGQKRKFNDRQIHLLEEAIKRPGTTFTIEKHQKFSGVSYLTARSDLESLNSKGLFRKTQVGNKSLYFAVDRIVQKLNIPEEQNR